MPVPVTIDIIATLASTPVDNVFGVPREGVAFARPLTQLYRLTNFVLLATVWRATTTRASRALVAPPTSCVQDAVCTDIVRATRTNFAASVTLAGLASSVTSTVDVINIPPASMVWAGAIDVSTTLAASFVSYVGRRPSGMLPRPMDVDRVDAMDTVTQTEDCAIRTRGCVIVVITPLAINATDVRRATLVMHAMDDRVTSTASIVRC